MSAPPKDIVFLVAGKDTVKGLLGRHESLSIRSLSVDIYVHPHRDPGCRSEGPNFLGSFQRGYARALLMFDREGSGSDAGVCQLQRECDQQLANSRWGRTGRELLSLTVNLKFGCGRIPLTCMRFSVGRVGIKSFTISCKEKGCGTRVNRNLLVQRGR